MREYGGDTEQTAGTGDSGSEARQRDRSGHYDRNPTTIYEDVTLHVPRLKGASFEMTIIEYYRRRESSMDELLRFPSEHRTRIRTNNIIERLNQEIRHRTRVVDTFQDWNSVLMLICDRLRHMTRTQWGNKKYMNIKHFETLYQDTSLAD